MEKQIKRLKARLTVRNCEILIGLFMLGKGLWLLHIIEYFVVGTAPDTSYVSYRKNPNFYVTNFFYDLFFFVIVSLVMYNVFLGVLYDTFSELRGNLQEKENDINNVCFICQLTRDGREHFGKTFKGVGYDDYFRTGYVAPVVNLTIDYKQSLKCGDVAVVETRYIPTEGAKLILEYDFLHRPRQAEGVGSRQLLHLPQDPGGPLYGGYASCSRDYEWSRK